MEDRSGILTLDKGDGAGLNAQSRCCVVKAWSAVYACLREGAASRAEVSKSPGTVCSQSTPGGSSCCGYANDIDLRDQTDPQPVRIAAVPTLDCTRDQLSLFLKRAEPRLDLRRAISQSSQVLPWPQWHTLLTRSTYSSTS